MELFGLACAFPIAAVISIGYSAFATLVLRRVTLIRRTVLGVSVIVLGAFVLQLIALGVFGCLGARQRFDGSFVVIHTVAILFAAPAVANALVLRDEAETPWFVAAFWCFCVVIACLFLNIATSEAWYGVDGMGGPYSQ